MNDLAITATAAGVGVTSALAIGVNAARAGGMAPVATASMALLGGTLLGAGAAWAVVRDAGPKRADSPFVLLPAVAGASLAGAGAYAMTRSVEGIGSAALSAAGPALLAGAAAAFAGALVYGHVTKGQS